MPQNGISYTARLVNNRGQCEFGLSKNGEGQFVLKLVLAEQHTGRNDKVAPKYQDRTKSADAYVPTTTSWHRVTMFGDAAQALAEDPGFNHGALIEVQNAQYVEEDPWTTKDNVERAGRPETIGKDSYLDIYEHNGKRFESRDEWQKPMLPEGEPLPILKVKGGGGGGPAPTYEGEGF